MKLQFSSSNPMVNIPSGINSQILYRGMKPNQRSTPNIAPSANIVMQKNMFSLIQNTAAKCDSCGK